jgi:hypothetical protein
MVITLEAKRGRDYGPGWLIFTYRPGFLSHNIATATAEKQHDAGNLVATHTGWITTDFKVAEALGHGFSLTPIYEYLKPMRDVFTWFKMPFGMTDTATKAMTDLANEWQGRDYDFEGVGGFVLPILGQDESALFCSEATVKALLAVEHLMSRPLPPVFHTRPPHKWSPYDLEACDALYRPLAA